MKQISQSLTQNGFLNPGLTLLGIGTDTATPSRKPRVRGRAKEPSPSLMVEMHRSNRIETPVWILLAVSACVALALSL